MTVAYRRISLTTYKKKKKPKTLRKLLEDASPSTGETGSATAAASVIDMQQALQCAAGDKSCATAAASEGDDEPILSYWKPTLDLSLVLDMPAFPRNSVPLIMGKVRGNSHSCAS